MIPLYFSATASQEVLFSSPSEEPISIKYRLEFIS